MATHVKAADLYPLYHLLSLHFLKKKPISSLGELPDELTKTLERLNHSKFERAPADEHAMKAQQVKSIVAHLKECQDCEVTVYEDGPGSKREKSAGEIDDAEKAREQEVIALKRKFFISVGYAIPALFGGRMAHVEYLKTQKAKPITGPTIQGTNQAKFQLHPLQMLAFALVLISAWGIVQCWEIANEVWLDWTKAKAAVPFVGKAWAEKGIKKKEEEERLRRNQS
jgi:hypothetical protein